MNKKFKIEKGTHYSKPFMFKFISGNKFYVKWSFLNRPKQNTRHTNKLIGIGYFPHHLQTSWRIGYERLNGKMIYSLFLHINGKFEIHPIPDLYKYSGSLSIELVNDVINISNMFEDAEKRILSVPFKTPKIKIGYMLKPYHGGKDTAINNYSVNVSLTKTKQQ